MNDNSGDPSGGEDLNNLRVAIAELRGELNKTPSRNDYYGTTLAVAGIFSAVFVGAVFLVLQSQQNDFETRVNEILDIRDRERALEFQSYLKELKSMDKILEKNE